MYAVYNVMKSIFKKRIKAFHPPIIFSVVSSILFSTLSIFNVATNWFERFSVFIPYVIYVCATVFLSLAVWSLFTMKTSPKKQFLIATGKNAFTARLTKDFSYRTIVVTSGSLVFNIMLAFTKMFAGLYYSSNWLMVLAGYYLILCLTKFLLLRYNRKQSKLTDKSTVLVHEWKAYRICGIMLLVLTAFLQGVVIMIVKNGMGFLYNEITVIAIATYDFYCLIGSSLYMIRKRKSHSPIVNSLKSISFASSLVAILSLQTAMFSAFGSGADTKLKLFMNILTGTVVCLSLIVLGILITIRSNKELKQGIEVTKENEKM